MGFDFGNLDGEPLTTKELAAALKRSRRYVQAMKNAGFKMHDGKAALTEARQWLAAHPPPCARRVA